MVHIVPSLLAADFSRLGEEIARVEAGGATMLHVDIMDGHFVPNLTMGPLIVQSIRKITQSVLDVHLMIEDPHTYAPIFIEAGADQVSIHAEAAKHMDSTLRLIQGLGARAGIVLNPGTPLSVLEDVLYLADFVLLMSVNPGFGGQKFIPHVLDKVSRLAGMRREMGLSFAIEIDGGVGRDNLESIVSAGCDWLVAGSSVFHSADPAATVREMQQMAEMAAQTVVRI